MAKSIKLVNPTEFVPPRAADGTFLPREFWSKRQVAAHKRAMRARAEMQTNPRSNPFLVKGKGKKESGWVPPRGPDGQFLPEDQWSKAEKRRHRKAVREGLLAGRPKPKPKKRKPRAKTTKAEAVDAAEIARAVGKEVGKEVAKAMAAAAEAEEEEPRLLYGEWPGEPPEERVKIQPMWEIEECPPDCVTFPGLKEKIADPLTELRQEIATIAQRAQAIEKAVSKKAANPIEALALVNRRRTLGDRFVGAVDFFKDNPLLALAGIAAAVVAAVLVVRAIRTKMSTMVRAVDITNGTMSFPGQSPYQITEHDMTWLARALLGEVSENAATWANPQTQRGGAAILWALANHYMTVGQKRDHYPTLSAFTRAYCQPLSARWSSIEAAGCQQQPDMCTPTRLARRRMVQTKSWSNMPPQLQFLVESFVAGRLPNPIGTRTDWLASTSRWRTPPADPMTVAGNTFATNAQARRREDVVA
jgi:hypothetical protein